MKRLGTVVAENGKHYVEYDRHEQCKACGACDSSRKLMLSEELSEGTRVEVEFSDSRIVPATALAFAFPLAGMLIGVGIGYWLGKGSAESEMWSAGLGIACAVFAYLILRLCRTRIARAFNAEIVKVTELLREEK